MAKLPQLFNHNGDLGDEGQAELSGRPSSMVKLLQLFYHVEGLGDIGEAQAELPARIDCLHVFLLCDLLYKDLCFR